MLRRFGSYLLAHDRNANIAAFLCALLSLFGIPIGFVAIIIVGLVTLRKGWKPGLVVLLWAMLPTVSLLVLRRFGLFDSLVPRCMAVWLLACLLRKTASLKLSLELCSLLAALAVLIAHFIFPDLLQWWQQALTRVAEHAQTSQMASVMHITPDQMLDMMQQFAPFATGLLGALVVADLFIQLVLARCWEGMITASGQAAKEFNRVRMGYFSGIAFLLLSIALYWRSPWLIDVYPVLVLPFAVAGLSLLHQIVRCKKGWMISLVLMYLLLFFITIPAALFLAFIGLLDSGYNFRKRCVSLQIK